jgi:hypothetical protein
MPLARALGFRVSLICNPNIHIISREGLQRKSLSVFRKRLARKPDGAVGIEVTRSALHRQARKNKNLLYRYKTKTLSKQFERVLTLNFNQNLFYFFVVHIRYAFVFISTCICSCISICIRVCVSATLLLVHGSIHFL